MAATSTKPNLNELMALADQMPTDRLMQATQNQSDIIPSYIAGAILNARNQTNQAAQAQQQANQPAPQGTVMDRIRQQSMNELLAAQQAYQQSNPMGQLQGLRGYAGGGEIRGFAAGSGTDIRKPIDVYRQLGIPSSYASPLPLPRNFTNYGRLGNEMPSGADIADMTDPVVQASLAQLATMQDRQNALTAQHAALQQDINDPLGMIGDIVKPKVAEIADLIKQYGSSAMDRIQQYGKNAGIMGSSAQGLDVPREYARKLGLSGDTSAPTSAGRFGFPGDPSAPELEGPSGSKPAAPTSAPAIPKDAANLLAKQPKPKDDRPPNKSVTDAHRDDQSRGGVGVPQDTVADSGAVAGAVIDNMVSAIKKEQPSESIDDKVRKYREMLGQDVDFSALQAQISQSEKDMLDERKAGVPMALAQMLAGFAGSYNEPFAVGGVNYRRGMAPALASGLMAGLQSYQDSERAAKADRKELLSATQALHELKRKITSGALEAASSASKIENEAAYHRGLLSSAERGHDIQERTLEQVDIPLGQARIASLNTAAAADMIRAKNSGMGGVGNADKAANMQIDNMLGAAKFAQANINDAVREGRKPDPRDEAIVAEYYRLVQPSNPATPPPAPKPIGGWSYANK